MRIYEVEPGSEYSELARIVFKSASVDSIPISELSFTDVIYLGAVLRAGVNKDFTCIIPRNDWSRPLTYIYDTDINILKYLHAKKILTVSTNSDINAIAEYSIPENSFTYYIDQVVYDINITTEGDGTKDDFINVILEPSFSKAPTSEVLKLWQDIAYTECIQTLDFRMTNYNLPYIAGKETKAFFDSIIPDFSLATIYTFIYQAARTAAAYYQEGNVSKRQAANSVLSRMRTIADRVRNRIYDRWEYDRPKECPQFILSDYFFNSVLQLRDRYWYSTPHNPFC